MSISERASAHLQPKEMPEAEQSIVEQFRIVALQYVDADGAANLMEELKTTTLEKMKSSVIEQRGDMADNKAERLAKCTPEWEQYIRDMVAHRSKATKLKLQLEYIKMIERQQDRQSWVDRSERKMGRSVA